jgi:hypothetical protein
VCFCAPLRRHGDAIMKKLIAVTAPTITDNSDLVSDYWFQVCAGDAALRVISPPFQGASKEAERFEKQISSVMLSEMPSSKLLDASSTGSVKVMWCLTNKKRSLQPAAQKASPRNSSSQSPLTSLPRRSTRPKAKSQLR